MAFFYKDLENCLIESKKYRRILEYVIFPRNGISELDSDDEAINMIVNYISQEYPFLVEDFFDRSGDELFDGFYFIAAALYLILYWDSNSEDARNRALNRLTPYLPEHKSHHDSEHNKGKVCDKSVFLLPKHEYRPDALSDS